MVKKLNEAQLKAIISESVKNVLNEINIDFISDNIDEGEAKRVLHRILMTLKVFEANGYAEELCSKNRKFNDLWEDLMRQFEGITQSNLTFKY